MKKTLIYILGVLGVAALTLNSCRDDDKTLFSYGDDILDGAFVHFVEEPPAVVGVTSVNELSYGGEIVDPLGNVANYKLEMYASISGVITDTVLVGSYNSFPVNLNLTAQDFADLLGITVTDINYGDAFFFMGEVTSDQGITYAGSAPEIGDDGSWIPNGRTHIEAYDPTNGYKDGFLFDFAIGCPANSFTVANVVGTWDIVNDPFGASLNESLQIVAGPAENQIKLVDFLGHGFDLIVDVDPETSAITVEDQQAWDSGVFGLPYGIAWVEGDGTAFACAGKMTFYLDHHIPNLGGWGVSIFQIEKQ